jgi:hypothetical protein
LLQRLEKQSEGREDELLSRLCRNLKERPVIRNVTVLPTGEILRGRQVIWSPQTRKETLKVHG